MTLCAKFRSYTSEGSICITLPPSLSLRDVCSSKTVLTGAAPY